MVELQFIAVFDFLSHEFMHHPFNEAYLRMLAYGFPGAEIGFHARKEHLDRLRPRLADIERISFHTCLPFGVPLGRSRHHPVGGFLAARACISQMRRVAIDKKASLTAVLGVDANLLSGLRCSWSRFSAAPLHMVLHNHLSESFHWRSRNPLLRLTDFPSVLRRPLPPRQRLVVLELGIKEAIADLFPAVAPNVDTLEHPILTSGRAHSVSRWRAKS